MSIVSGHLPEHALLVGMSTTALTSKDPAMSCVVLSMPENVCAKVHGLLQAESPLIARY